MLSVVTIFFIILQRSTTFAIPMSTYENARFQASDDHFISANLSSIASRAACICQCWTNSMCVTGSFNGAAQTCLLFFAQLNEGNLGLMTSDTHSVVFSFPNKTITAPSAIHRPNETAYAIWNTNAGGDSSVSIEGSSEGDYYTKEGPSGVFDGIVATNYNNFGSCNLTVNALDCGEKTGFYVTLKRGPSLLRAFRIRAGHYTVKRDPLTITLEGSNEDSSLLTLGSSWSVIYQGSTGLDVEPGRATFGQVETIANNSVWYSSYRLLVTAKKGVEASAEYAEVEFLGY